MVLYPELLEDYPSWDVERMSKYNFGNFRLNKGDNKFEIIFKKDDAHRSEPKYITCIDYLDFIPVAPEFKLKDIVCDTSSANVFFEDENVVIGFDFTALADSEKALKYSLYDVNGRTKAKGSVKVNQGENNNLITPEDWLVNLSQIHIPKTECFIYLF